ncbi:MAG TPA: hypothetical protein VGQ19_10400 [Burkholderiales bacterium]|nr:hypothetical protein [Burkholderiales bacterium]
MHVVELMCRKLMNQGSMQQDFLADLSSVDCRIALVGYPLEISLATGAQDHPNSGQYRQGKESVAHDLVRSCDEIRMN